MAEYHFTIYAAVDAKDQDEADAIAKHLRELVEGNPLAAAGQQYKTRLVDVDYELVSP